MRNYSASLRLSEGEESNLPVALGFSDARLLMLIRNPVRHSISAPSSVMSAGRLSRFTPADPYLPLPSRVRTALLFTLFFSTKGSPIMRQKQHNTNLDASQCLSSMTRMTIPKSSISHPMILRHSIYQPILKFSKSSHAMQPFSTFITLYDR